MELQERINRMANIARSEEILVAEPPPGADYILIRVSVPDAPDLSEIVKVRSMPALRQIIGR